ncbi:hypothetical protein KFE25_011036 [Diacronema lutheri]|uniref:NAD-dependent epimerase/dehydratase domain-containing protein n=1 Tax=Diacronema lutheri TaxID=2081491 RepID=A0A7R9YNX4_DIALT|nr:hypothetical protein KFE25_011036 [Diacronema lutheri]|mmetsp:Transcript_7622/g.24120  ORF Transcript_7622/g.24120 Transcript_7622/m.24120 type:complete len:505 (+) Transcript_7622:92-1606(+)
MLHLIDEFLADLWCQRLQVKVRERHCVGHMAEVAVLMDSVTVVWVALAIFLGVELFIYTLSYLHGVYGDGTGVTPVVAFVYGVFPVIGKRSELVPLFLQTGLGLLLLHGLVRVQLALTTQAQLSQHPDSLRNFDEEYRAQEARYACAQARPVVLVTGAAGFVGNNLVRALLRQGRTVRVLIYQGDRLGLEELADDLTFVDGDITNVADVERAVAGADTVFHLASLVSLRARDLPILTKVNVTGTQNIVDMCLKHKVKRLVHFGSIHALNAFPEHEPVREDRPLALDGNDPDIAPYDLTKAMAEQRVIDALGDGLQAIRITPVGIWGPGDRLPSLLGRYLLQLYDRRLPCLPQGGFFFVDVRDVVHACLKAEEYGEVGRRYVLKGHYVSMPALSRLVYEVTGESRPWSPSIPMWVALAAAELCKHFNGDELGFNPACIRPIRYYQTIIDKMTQTELKGISFRPLEVTLKDTFEYFLAVNYCVPGNGSRAQLRKGPSYTTSLNCLR